MPILNSYDRASQFGDIGFLPLKSERSVPQITPQGRRYAVKELARRAGVAKELFDRWKIEVDREKTIVHFSKESNAKMTFLHQGDWALDGDTNGTIPISRAAWLNDQAPLDCEMDLICPFCRSSEDSRKPLYRPAENGGLICRLDVLASTLFTLSRVEEVQSGAVDEHGRFPASMSLAAREGLLERPIVDEIGLAFQQALSSLFPTWVPETPALKLKLTHDIDYIGIPLEIGTAIGHTLVRYRPAATFRDLLSTFSGALPAELAQVLRVADISSARGISSAFFWKGSPRAPFDSGYDPAHSKVQTVIHTLRDRGFELGVHPGYETFGNLAKLAQEVDKLRRALCVESPGGRQHYLRWSPDTWMDWEACGLSYDSSLGFADRFGFRAGTGFPYRPWSFRQNRELNLIEVPLILMDCTPVKYMKLPREEALQRIVSVVQRMKRCGGVFTLLWHNTILLDPVYDGWYEAILNLLDGAENLSIDGAIQDFW